MSILSLIKAGALSRARGSVAAGASLGDAIRNLRNVYDTGRGSRSTYEDFRNIVRRAQRQHAAGERLQAGEKPTKSTKLPTLPVTPSRPAGQHEYETIIKITPPDGGKVERVPMTVISPKALTPEEIRGQAEANLPDYLASNRTSTRSGILQVDTTGAPPRLDVIITSASVRS